MADDSRSDCVTWSSLFPLAILLRAMRLAVSVRALLLASLALLLTFLGWSIAGWIFRMPAEDEWNLANPTATTFWPWQHPPLLLMSTEIENWSTSAPGWNQTLLLPWQHLSRPFRRAFDANLGLTACVYLLVCGAWATAVWAFFGGAIARGAAVALARDEALGWGQVLSYARAKWLSIVAAPFVPLLGIAMLAIPLAIFGLIMQVPGIGMLFAGLVWPLALLVAVGMTVLALGLLFGWPLMWATISAEGSDAFDAVSRSYAYVYHRPLHYLFYVAQAALLGLAGWALVNLFATTVLTMASWGVSWGTGKDAGDTVMHAFMAPAEDLSGTESAGAALVRFWTRVVWTIAGAFSYSYLFTAATAIYFVLRQQVDATERDEIYLTGEGDSFGLPPLEADALGVPGVKDVPPGDPAAQGQTPTEG
jgi:hypothetical protein